MPFSKSQMASSMHPQTPVASADSSNHEKVARFGQLFAETLRSTGHGLTKAGTPKQTDQEFDTPDEDDIFGTPEDQTRQPVSRKSSLMPSPGTVLDACFANDEDGLCHLLRKGVTKAALNKKHSKNGRTGLAFACAQGYLGILDILVGMGPILDVNAADNEGNTPLHLAAEAGHADILSNLLAFFRDVQIDSRNQSGLTPLMKAAIQGRTNCAKILLFAGACPALRDVGRCLCATEWAKLCGRHGTAETIERFPHTSCLLHPSVHSLHTTASSVADRSSGQQVAQRLAYSSSGTSGVSSRQPPNGQTSQGTHHHDSPKGLTVRRTYRAASEPNLQARGSVQLQLEQLQAMSQPPLRRRPSWIRKRLKQALGIDKLQRNSLQPGQINRFGSTPSLANSAVMNSSLPFSCVGHRTSVPGYSGGASSGKHRPPMIVPKVKIQHTDSQQDILKVENPEKKHKLDFKRVMMFRKRSSSTSTQSSKKI